MKGLCVIGGLAAMAVLLTGCIVPTGAPLYGGIYTGIKGPGMAIDPGATFSKVGTSQGQGIVFVATGDASIETAAKSVGITKIHHVDVAYMTILGVYGTVTTTVYGE